MEDIVSKKKDETRRRWETAIKDRNIDCIRNLSVCETRAEHFDKALADGKVSTNVYLRRIHNHALGMDWLLKSVIPRLQSKLARETGGAILQPAGHGGAVDQSRQERGQMDRPVLPRLRGQPGAAATVRA